MKPQFRDIRDRLRYVGKKHDDYDLSSFPDFMAIGPQRTGTTWLGEQLKFHPQVFIPWQKEIHYFNNLEYPEFHPKSLPPVDKELGWYLDQFKIPEDWRRRREKDCLRETGRRFDPCAFGDLTATYAAAVHEGIIEDILTLNPALKIIVLVRDPIRRAWSHANKDLCTQRGRAVEDVPCEEWLEFIRNEYQVECGKYTTWLERWRKFVPAENLLIQPFRRIKEDPRGLLIRVHEFLGLDVSEKFVGPTVERRKAGLPEGMDAKATRASDIPDEVRDALEELFGDEIARLREQDML